MIRRSAVRKRRKGVRRGPARSAEYRAWIRTLPCVICNRQPSECAHVGTRGLGQRCSDFETVPLCEEHHRTGPNAHHVIGRRFEGVHGISFAAIIQALRYAYTNQKEVAA